MDLKRQIQAKGLKIKWVAEKIGISFNLLSQYLNGGRNMPIHIEDRIKILLK